LPGDGGHVFLCASLAELDTPWSPFSIRTMEKFARKDADAEAGLYFIAGGDSLLDVPSWRASTELLTSYNSIFVARPGVAGADAAPCSPRRLHRAFVIGAIYLRRS